MPATSSVTESSKYPTTTPQQPPPPLLHLPSLQNTTPPINVDALLYFIEDLGLAGKSSSSSSGSSSSSSGSASGSSSKSSGSSNVLIPSISSSPSSSSASLSHFTPDEKRRMLESEAGDRLARAIYKCEGIKRKMAQRQQQQQQQQESESAGNNNKSQRKKMQKRSNRISAMQSPKYAECLSHMSCPARWIAYTQCWDQFAPLRFSQMRHVTPTLPRDGSVSPSAADRQRRSSSDMVLRRMALPCAMEKRALEHCVGHLVSSSVRAALSPVTAPAMPVPVCQPSSFTSSASPAQTHPGLNVAALDADASPIL